MKKKLFLLIAAFMAMGQNAFAYDFSAVSPSGQTLYYKIIDSVNHYVMLTYPNDEIIDPSWLHWSTGEELWSPHPMPALSLTIPESVTYNGVTYSVKSVGVHTFKECPYLTTVIMPNSIEELGECAFLRCSNLQSVTFSTTLREIGGAAFAWCSLNEVILPNSLITIGSEAFRDNKITSLYIPSAVSSIGGSRKIIANGCPLLTSIIVDPNNPYFDSRNNCNAIISSFSGELIQGCYNTTVPEGVYSISANAFADYNISKLILSNTVINYSIDWSSIDTLVISASQSFRFSYFHESTIGTLIVLSETPPALTIQDYIYSIPVIVPCGAGAAYRASEPWNNFINISEPGVPQLTVNAEHGTAEVVTLPTCSNDTATVSATTTEEHYHFVRWSDGSTQNPYSLVLNSNTTLTAIFAIDSVLVRATSANPTKGTVMGGGVVPLGGTTTLTAIPTDDNIFLCWSNGVRNNPYTLTVNSDTTLQAMFTLPDTLVVYDTVYVPVHDTTYVPVHDTTIEYINHYIHDTTFVNNYVHDTMIQYVSQYIHDTTYINNYVHDTMTQYVNQYIHDTTYINNYVHDTMTQYVNQYVHDTTFINNYIHDTVRMTTQMFDTTIVNVFYFDTAIYNTYHFDTTIIHNQYYDTIFVHLHDTIYITQEGIDGIDGINAKVYSSNGQVVVEGADGNMVTLYDVTGRILATKQDDGTLLRFDAPASGTYMIKIGNYQTRKVVVIR